MIFKQITKLVLFFLLLILPSASSEELERTRHYFNAYENPIYYKYFDDYMNIIGAEYNKFKFFSKDLFYSFEYKIYADGTIGEIKTNSISRFSPNRDKIQKMLIKNPPPKFYDGMNKKYLNIDISFGTNKYHDEYTVDYHPTWEHIEEHFTITMDRKI